MAVCRTRKNFYTLTPLAGDCGRQLVLGYHEARAIAKDIARRNDTVVIVRNEAAMLQWEVDG